MGWVGPRVIHQILHISIMPKRGKDQKRTLVLTGLAPPACGELGRTNGTGWAPGDPPDPTDFGISGAKIKKARVF